METKPLIASILVQWLLSVVFILLLASLFVPSSEAAPYWDVGVLNQDGRTVSDSLTRELAYENGKPVGIKVAVRCGFAPHSDPLSPSPHVFVRTSCLLPRTIRVWEQLDANGDAGRVIAQATLSLGGGVSACTVPASRTYGTGVFEHLFCLSPSVLSKLKLDAQSGPQSLVLTSEPAPSQQLEPLYQDGWASLTEPDAQRSETVVVNLKKAGRLEGSLQTYSKGVYLVHRLVCVSELDGLPIGCSQKAFSVPFFKNGRVGTCSSMRDVVSKRKDFYWLSSSPYVSATKLPALKKKTAAQALKLYRADLERNRLKVDFSPFKCN